jgi:hypothetical protein
MPPSIRQQAQGFTGIATTITVPFASANLSGNLLVAFAYVNFSVARFATITDTLGNTWQYVPYYTTGTPWDGAPAIWICTNSLAGANSVTVACSSTNLLQLQIYEVDGWILQAELRTTGHNSLTNTSPSCATDNPAVGGDYAMAFLWVNGSGGGPGVTYPFTAGSGFTMEQQQAGSFSIYTATEDQAVPSGGTLTATFGGLGASQPWGCYSLVFGDTGSQRPQMFIIT